MVHRVRARGPTELWDWRVPLRHIDQMVKQSYSLEWLICIVCDILGNSLSIYAYRVVLCVSGTSEDRGKAPT